MTTLDVAALAGRGLHLTALAVIVGAGLAPELRATATGTASRGPDALAVVSERWRRSGAVGLLLGLGVLLVAQAVAFRDPFEPWLPQVQALLLRTDWGRTFSVQAVVAAGLWIPAVRTRSRAVLSLGLLSAGTLAFTGHSWAAAEGAWVVAADALHGVAASLWVGGLLVLVAAARLDRAAAAGQGVAVADAGRSFDLPGAVGRFSTLALVCVPTVVGTGAAASWVHGGGPGALLTPGWGRALAVKLALVGVMALLGLFNWRATLPALRSRGDEVRFGSGPAAWEAVVGVLVLLATAALVALSPPG